MSTRFYSGQKDYIVQLNLMDDSFSAATNSVVSDTTTNASVFPTFAMSASGPQNLRVSSSKLFFNPSTGLLTTTAITTTGAMTVGGNLTVTGNLVINGTTTTVNSTTVTLDDPILTLGGDTAPTVDDNKDRGIEFRWHNGTVAKLGFFGFDDSTGRMTFIPDATNTSEVFAGTVGTIEANLLGNVTGNVTGNLTGNASGTASALATPRAINGVNFDGTAAITVKASTTNAITFNNGGTGAASGTTFDGSAAITISFNTIGAAGTGANNTFSGTNTFNSTVTVSGTQVDIGTSTAATNVNIAGGATVSGATKTVNIGTAGVAGSTTTINFGNSAGTVSYTFNGFSGIVLPVGTTANRPAGSTGLIRFNTDLVQFEGYNGTSWTSVGGGAKGGGADQAFFENDVAVTTNYTITTNKNAMTAGPITINTGATVTIPTGSTWSIV
jgi:hypothetical protein